MSINIYSIPYEIFLKNIIIKYLIPSDNLDFKTFISYREVSRLFYYYFKDNSIIRKVKEEFGVKYVKRKNEPFLEEWKYIQRLTNDLYKTIYPIEMIEAFYGLQNILELPVLYGAKWYVIQRLYTINYNYVGTKHDPWEKLKKKMNYPIMRGCDDFGIHFIVFKYYNYTVKKYQLEFLYEGNLRKNRTINWTFIGEGSYTFIGSVSMNENPYRRLSHKNWLMLKYIVSNKNLFIANLPDTKKNPNTTLIPIKPYYNDYWSDEESEEDELNPEYTLKKINKSLVNMVSLEY